MLRVDPRFYRPIEPTALVGDARQAKKILSWKAKTVGTDVARLMARADYDSLGLGH